MTRRRRSHLRTAAVLMGYLAANAAVAGYGGLVITPDPVSFAPQPIQTTSVAQVLTLDVASPGSSLSISSVTVPSPFQRSGGSCPSSGPVSPPCTIEVQFAPQEVNEFSRTLAVVASVNKQPGSFAATLLGSSSENADVGFEPGDVTLSQTSVEVGDGLTLSIQPRNAGPSVVFNASVTVQLPEQLVLAQPVGSNANWSCSNSKTELSCFQGYPISRGASLGALPQVQLQAVTAGTGTVAVSINGPGFDGNSGNNAVFLPVTVLGGSVGDLTPSFSGPGMPVEPGGTFSISGSLLNVGSEGFKGPIQLRVESTPVATYSGFSGSGWECFGSGAVVNCVNSIGPPAGGSSIPLTLNYVAPPVPGQVSLEVRNMTSDGNSGNDVQTLLVNVGEEEPDFILNGSAAPLSGGVPFNSEVQLQASVVNPTFTFGYVIEAKLPAGVSFVAAQTGTGWDCSAPGSPIIECNLDAYSGDTVRQSRGAVLPPLNLTLSKTSVGSSTVVFDFYASSKTPDADPSNNTYTLVLTGNAPVVDLAIQKTASVSAVAPGDTFSYQLLVRNNGPGVAGGISVQDSLPAGLTLLGISFGSGSGSWGCSTSGGVVCSLDSSLSPGTSAPAITLDVRYEPVAPASQISNTATVSAQQTDSQPANNSSTAVVSVTQPSQLQLRKTASRPQLSVGESLDFVLDVDNPGTVAATGVVLLDAVPAAFAVTGVQSTQLNCTHSGNDVDCRANELAPGSSAQVVVAVRAVNPGTHANIARLTSVEVSEPMTASATVQVQLAAALADLSVSKTASVSTVTSGQAFSYQIEVRNQGAAEARDVVVEDLLPDGITLVSVDASGASCQGSSSVVCSLTAPLAAGGVLALNLNVRADAVVSGGCQVRVNQVAVRTSSAESSLDNNNASASVSICAGGMSLYDLALSVSPSSAPAQAQTFSLTVVNQGAGGYPGGTLEIDFGATNLRLQSFLGCTVDAQLAVCTLPPLASSQSQTFPLQVRTSALPPAAGQIGLFAPPVAPGDANPGNNSTFVVITRDDEGGGNIADLQLSGRALSTEGLAGDTANFEFIATNLGPATATGVQVLLELPAGARLGNAQANGASCTTNGLQVRCVATADLLREQSLVVNLAIILPAELGEAVVRGTVSANVPDLVPGNNSASVSTRVRLENVSEAAVALNSCIGNDQIAQISVDALARACADPNSPLQPLCRQLLSANDPQTCGEVRQVLTEIAPKDVLAQSLLLRDFANTQFFNVDARLSDLRGGSGGFSIAGLNVRSGRSSMSFGTLQDLVRAVQGGGDTDTAEYDPDLVSPWGFFMNGTISSGDQALNTERYRVKTDFESRGLTAGVDYRFKPNLVGGLAVGFAKFDADISNLSSMDTRALSLTAYGSWYPRDRLYLDARFSFGSARFDLNRRIDFSIGDQSFSTTALGRTDADQLTFAASVGHHYNLGGWNLTPNLAFRHVRSEVDAFTETGAGMFNVAYGKQSISSSQLALGLQFGRAFSLSHGVISPQFDFALNRDFSDDDLVLEARLAGEGAQGVFELREEDPDESYGSVGLGFVYLTANGKQAYMSYRRNVGQDGINRFTLNFGLRFEF